MVDCKVIMNTPVSPAVKSVQLEELEQCEPAWSGGKRKKAGSTPSFGSPFSSKIVIIWTLSRDFALHN